MKSGNPFARPRIVLGRGPRAVERALLDSVEHSLEVLGLEVLKRPIHLLVPSHSLRHHLLDRLVRERRQSVAGLSCWTLRSLAQEILERAGETPPLSNRMLPLLVRRGAKEERALRECLDHLRDGYGSLVGTVTDLLEAGLDPAHGEAIEESLFAEGRSVASAAEIRRAQSLVRVAIQVQEELTTRDLGSVTSLLQRAVEVLQMHPDPLLPSSGIHVYGFADATGVGTDLILATVRRFGGTIYLDRPPDPADWQRDEPVIDFGRRFNERLFDLGAVEPAAIDQPDPPQVALISALGTQAEVREIGWRIRRLLDAGTRPESIAIVARQLEPYRSALRTHLGRLGIPYSALSTPGPQLPAGRRVRALLDLLIRRQQVRLDRWLDARNAEFGDTHLFDLRLALFGLGVSRLEELAALPLDRHLRRETYPLPARRGFLDDDGDTVLQRRQIPTAALSQARGEAVQLCDLFAAWGGVGDWSGHSDHFAQLLSVLGWERDPTILGEVHQALERAGRGVVAGFELDLEEWTQLMTEALESLGRQRLGGHGGGVQILDVIEARGRTFDHLFLMGMNKGIFPRTVREDPAFPDALRQVLGREGHGVLPDLPRKRTGHAEERFLFAQLCASSPDLTLSWQEATDDNKRVTPSPLVERLLWSSQAIQVRPPQTIAPAAETDPAPRTELENGIRAALWGSRRNLQANLAAAVPADQSKIARKLSQARLAIVDELNQPSGGGSRLGPYFGFIGQAGHPLDPRLGQDLYVTTLESFAACPWRTFIEKILRLETLPDPIDILPGLEPLLIGQLVHRVLEKLVSQRVDHHPASLAEARRCTPAPVSWPDAENLTTLVERQATVVANEQGVVWEGYPAILAQVVMPFLEQARHLAWSETVSGGPVAAEMDCGLTLESIPASPALRFRADRVDLHDDNLVLTDYKTSRLGVSSAKTRKTREKHLLAEIGKGRLLQAAAYALASGGPNDEGRYLFVRPDFTGPEATRTVTIRGSDREARAAFEQAVSTLLESWRSGTFFPRLVAADRDVEPRACQYCAVAEACLRGDSGARGRLRDWPTTEADPTGVKAVFLDTWMLGSLEEEPK